MNQREMPMFSSVCVKNADEQTLRLCITEEDAIAVSLRLSGCSQSEIAKRMGVSSAYVTLLKKGERTLTSNMAQKLIDATGWNLVRQYRDLQSALRIAQGRPREIDRIAHIASFTRAA